MKAVAISLALGAGFTLGLAPSAAASASAAPSVLPIPLIHRCTPSEPSFVSLAATATVSCREARAMNTYMLRHETLSGGFELRGQTWRGAVYSRAHDQTYMVYRHGAQRIWLTYGGEAS